MNRFGFELLHELKAKKLQPVKMSEVEKKEVDVESVPEQNGTNDVDANAEVADEKTANVKKNKKKNKKKQTSEYDNRFSSDNKKKHIY